MKTRGITPPQNEDTAINFYDFYKKYLEFILNSNKAFKFWSAEFQVSNNDNRWQWKAFKGH